MTTFSASTMIPEQSSDSSLEERLVEALADYHDAADRGQPPDRSTFLQKYADVSEELAGYLDSFDLIRAVAPQLREPGGAGDSPVLPERATLGDFRILREIGRGGMGVVYEAEQLSVGRRVALKVLPFAAMLKSQQLDRFRNEVRAAGSLNHSHIVAVYSVGNERGVHYYAMQLVEGHSLAEMIERMRKQEKVRGQRLEVGEESNVPSPEPLVPNSQNDTVAALSTVRDTHPSEYWRVVAELGQQTAEALDHAHRRGVVHRDIKPANLLVGSEGHLWVTDFGLARLESDVSMTMSGDLLGTLRYMSPEQAAGDRAVVDHRTDIYSLGATLYELLATRPPFESNDRQQLLHDVSNTQPKSLHKVDTRIPADLETIVAKAMEKDAADRYATADDLAADLGNFLEYRAISAHPPTLWERSRKWARRRPQVVLAAFAVMLLATVGSLLAATLIAGANRRATTEKAQAEENLRLAAATIDKLLIRVGADAQAHSQLRHADELLRDAVHSYDQLLAKSDDPALVLKSASAHNQLSEVLRLGAELSEAQNVAEDGLKLLQRLPENMAQSEEVLSLRATLLGASGMATLSDRNYAPAEWSLRESLALRSQLSAAEPHDMARRKALLLAHNNLGVLLMESDRLDEGEQELRAAEALHQTLPQEEQNTVERLNQRAGLQANVAAIAVKRGDYSSAVRDFRSAVEIQHLVVDKLPEDPAHREDLYKFRWNLTDVLVRAGRHQEAYDEVKSISAEFLGRLQAQVEGVWLLVRCIKEVQTSEAIHYIDLAHELLARSEFAQFSPRSRREDLGWLLATCPVRELRDGKRALEISESLCAADPKVAMHFDCLSAAQLELGHYDPAKAAVQNAYRLDRSAYEMVLLALAEAGLGHRDEAARWQEKAFNAHAAMGDHTDLGLRALVNDMQDHLQGDGS